MKPEYFNEVNVVLAKEQPQYLQLPAYRDAEGLTTTCWKMSWRERFQAFFNGRIWLQTLTFNQPFQPVKLTVEREK